MEKGHLLDLEKQGKHGVNYRAYWVNVTDGNVYCLAESPSAEAASAVHRDVDGTVADQIWAVSEAPEVIPPKGTGNLYMETLEMGPGKVNAGEFAALQKKQIPVAAEHGVTVLNHWVDATTGTVHRLVEASDPDAVRKFHKATGLSAASFDEVVYGK